MGAPSTVAWVPMVGSADGGTVVKAVPDCVELGRVLFDCADCVELEEMGIDDCTATVLEGQLGNVGKVVGPAAGVMVNPHGCALPVAIAYVEESLQTHQPVAPTAGQKPSAPSGSASCWHPKAGAAVVAGLCTGTTVNVVVLPPAVVAGLCLGLRCGDAEIRGRPNSANDKA